MAKDFSLAPGFLIASPVLVGDAFEEALVLLVEHDEEGAFGLVVNRVSKIGLRDLLAEMGMDAAWSISDPVYLGGPISTDTGWVVFRFDPDSDLPEDAKEIADGIAISSSRAVLQMIAKGTHTDDFLFVIGHAGWGPGQLEEEVADGAWLPTPLETSWVFGGSDPESWKRALGSMGLSPIQWAKPERVLN